MTARERLLKRRPRTIEIDGDKITVRSLTVGETIRVQSMLGDVSQEAAVAAFIAAKCVLNDDGTQLFSGDDDPAIQEIPTDTLTLIADAAMKMSRYGDVEKAKKN